MNSRRSGAVGAGLIVAVLGLLGLVMQDSNGSRIEIGSKTAASRQASPPKASFGRAPAGSALVEKAPGAALDNVSGTPLAQAPTQLMPSAAVIDTAARIDFLERCYDQDCNFPRTDEKSYDFAIGLELKKSIYELQALIETENRIDPVIATLAQQELANPDGHVKEAALHLIATQPPSPESLEAILQHVIKDYDALLIEHALLELARYTAPRDAEKIRQALADGMLTGAPFVSVAIAENIAPFINEQSYRFFESVNGRLPPNTMARLQLQSFLTTFRRQLNGA